MSNVRVRFAPSPTGALHIGGVRTALYNYLFARQNGGKMLLRIEDTDSNRFVPGAEEYIIESLKWLGIEIDEGVGVGGEHAPYRQSERKDIYRKYVDQLLNDGKAYIAFDTPEQLEAKRNEIKNFQYDATTRGMMTNSLTLDTEEVKSRIANGDNYVVRIKIEPGEEVEVDDLIRGKVVINSSIIDDKVLYKSADNLPTYHLANIVDDHLMEITHVIRGEEWLPSAPLHVLLYRYLGWADTMPRFAHLPLLLKPQGNGKLSKRDGDKLGFPVFPLEWTDPKTGEKSKGYREEGYLPEAVINFLALLGWHPSSDQEMFTMDELIKEFSLDRVSKSGAKFDFEKGKWFNHQYLEKKDNNDLAVYLKKELDARGIKATDENIAKAAGHAKARANFANELWEQASFFFIAPESYDEKTAKKRWKAETPEIMSQLYTVFEGIEDFSLENTEKIVTKWIEEKGYGMGAVMNPLRLALVGESKGPHMFDITEILGKEETLRRLKKAIEVIPVSE
ncbi:MAG: glutamate--tRNA ligase [Paludibacteraceae bacterium]|nr:glutamate--tRNA ligase [Paludibacteraceae bacterium]MBQ7747580.1 glutamate--tRNA ligase [Paludibacteraceae bacterium]